MPNAAGLRKAKQIGQLIIAMEFNNLILNTCYPNADI
jgi:hypothetical protein